MSRLDGTVVAVTGAARGIGLATVRALRTAGASVALGDVDAVAVKEAGAALSAEPGAGGVFATELDVTSLHSFAAFLDRTEAELGPLDVIVNNAGIMPVGHLLDEDLAIATRCLDINVHGVITGTKLALARMVPRGTGHVINIASVAGVVPAPGQATYAASKHAVVGFTEAVRLEFADRGVNVSAVLPSFTNTELVAGTTTPRGTSNIEPDDIAAVVVRLIEHPRPRVIVPGQLAVMLRLQQLIPRRLREALGRALGVDRVFLDFDPAARRAYDERIRS